MNHLHLPDPVKEDITVLQHENAELVNRVLDLEKEVRILSAGAGASQE
jgi:serine O-acetyltransferase